MKTSKKTLGITFIMLVLTLTMLSFASAEFKACFTKGDKYTYCTNQDKITLSNCNSKYCTCQYTLCTPCFKSYDPVRECYVGGNSAVCLKMPTDCSGDVPGGGVVSDGEPPELKILNPLNNSIQNSRRIDLKLTLNEIAEIQYRDLNKPGSISWMRICPKCPVSTSSNPYSKSITFKEGQNSLLFKATDLNGNPTEVEVNFFVDSIKPTLSTALPRANSFADGSFEIKFRELNPKRVTLYYGTDKTNLDLSKCTYASNQYLCTIDVNLNKYTGQTIGYYFEVEDIAGTSVSSRSTQIKVDTKPPVLNNPDSFFKIVNKRYIEFNLSISEDNLYRITSKNTLNPRSPTTTLCTKLTNGYCYKKVAFTKGDYSLSIEISDKAGNIIAVPATFTIDY